jgi:SAM-dependent methyltransferase
MTASPGRRGRAGLRLVRGLAFGIAAGAYERLTDGPAWREDCRAMAALVPGRRVLDVGVGPGVSALEMAAAAPETLFVGLDLSAPMLRRTRSRAAAARVSLPLVRGDALRLPFADSAFDGAAGHSLLYLLEDPEAALAEVARVVRPGGGVAFLEPRRGPALLLRGVAGGARPDLSMALWRVMSGLHRRYSPEDLASLLARCGLREARAWPVLGGLGVVASARRP